MKKCEHENFICAELDEQDIEFCLKHAKLMCNGASTYSFKHSKMQSEDVYFIGKIGEYLILKFLESLEQKGMLKILHTPFREKYGKFNSNDDFIIEAEGKRIQLEVRTKARNVDVALDYEQCSDCIRPHLHYLFVSYNRKNNKIFFVGSAGWEEWKKFGCPVLKGEKNNNFTHKSNEFDIKIKNLIKPKEWTKKIPVI